MKDGTFTAALAATLPAVGMKLDATLPLAGPQQEAAAGRRLDLVVPGTRIGRYEVESLLGSGGLGVVYAARDPELGRRVALKLLKPSPQRSAEEQERLLVEAQAMARISHPNVLAVHDVGRWQDRVYVAMDLVEGGHLRDWLRRAPRSINEIVDAFRAAGEGLAAAHDAGLVHRDFKPENVLVSADGHVSVTDFGLAREFEKPAESAGVMAGTPAYMAPEQWEGTNVDPRSDQFGFCVALYEALYGERPFAADDPLGLLTAIVTGSVRPPPRGARVPSSLRGIIIRGLSHRPGDRWPSLEALLAALGRDRTKLPRRIAVTSVATLAVLATAAAGDWIVRSRLYAATRASFAATRGQIGRMVRLRYETFSALADLSTLVPIMREVAAIRDEADFGLGKAEEDQRRLSRLHQSLRDADWDAWASTTRLGELAIVDYKGRLLYSTGNPDAFGEDVSRIPAVAEIYRAGGPGVIGTVTRADDPRLLAAGIVKEPRSGLRILFGRAHVLAGVTQAVFIQAIEARHLLADLSGDADLHLALITPDGESDGALSPVLVDAGRKTRDAMVEIAERGRRWLVQGHAVPGIGEGAPAIALIVMAGPADVGLSGLFPNARAFLTVAAILALLALGLALWALSRDGR